MRRSLALLAPLLLAPLPLGARSDGPERPIAAPGAGETTVVDGLKVRATLARREGKRLVVMVSAENPSPAELSRTLRVEVSERPPSSPMARMIPMPRQVGSTVLEVVLGPGKQLQKELVIMATSDAPAGEGARTLVLVRSASAPTEAIHGLGVRRPVPQHRPGNTARLARAGR